MKPLLFLLCVASAFAADAPTLHPKASALPFTHQGPFVSTADGGVLCIDTHNTLRSDDEGRSWKTSTMFEGPAKFAVSNERALLRTREGVILSAWMNGAERQAPKTWHWGEKDVQWTDFILPTYSSRSTDDGKTWEKPVKLSDPWCGCIHSLIQMKSGRIVLVGQEIIPQWRHATVMWASDDLGKTWQRGDVLDYGIGAHDHAGSIEGSVIERKDGSLYLLLRTESGYLWEATSRDGLKWDGLKQTTIKSVTCCPQMARLADGRIALLWNPSELWITTMQGGLRMKINTADLGAGEIPVFVPPPKSVPKPGGIIMFGDSTTAPRGSVKVYAERVQTALQGIGSSLSVYNAGVPSNTTVQALKRLKQEVLAYKPRVVVMQFGINDSAVDVWRNPPMTAPRVSRDVFLENYRAMITATQKQGAKVILMTTNPLRWTSKLRELYGKPPYNADVEDGFEALNLVRYNEALRKLATELKVPLVDVHSAYPAFAAKNKATVEAMLTDGMHPGDLGHQLVAELLVPVIRDAVR